ncbi:hypothetical protein H4R19_000043 [Coemansia spiralis]|nr:hypothetical protein H4R19_000043 [Coemansia spiralis]
MELPDVGRRCSREGCRQLDFLAAVCPYCDRPFCSTHVAVFAHTCPCTPRGNVVEQPRAREPLAVDRPAPDTATPHSSGPMQKKTLTHEQQQALVAARQASDARSQPAAKPASRRPTVSPKIELMRLKARATGNASIADADRLYLSIQWQGKATPVFLNVNAVVGNAAAQLARQLRLTMLPDRVYRLQPPGASEPLASNMTFRELAAGDDASHALFNGCTLELCC